MPDKKATFILKAVCALILSAMCISAQQKPNIILIIADDHGYYHMTPYGDGSIPTPNLQKLADQGLKFNRAYVATPYCVPSRYSLFSGLNPDRHGVEGNHENRYLKPGLERIVERMYGQGYEIAMKGKVEHEFNTADADFYTRDSAQFANLETFLKSRNKSKPLLLFQGYTNTHTVWPEANPARCDPAKVVLPAKTPDCAATRLMHSRYILGVMDLDKLIGEFITLISANLDMSNTLVMYTSDHGQNWLFGKWTLNETGVRTPLIAVWPGKIQPNTTTDALVDWVDIIPTFIDVAGGTTPDSLDGHSFKKVLLRQTDYFRDTLLTFLKGEGGAVVHPARAVRTNNWKYIFYPHPEFYYHSYMEVEIGDLNPSAHRFANWPDWEIGALKDQKTAQNWYDFRVKPPEELFRVNEDPWEYDNLAYDPRYADTLAALRKIVKDRMLKVKDTVALSGKPLYLKDMQAKIPPAIKIYYPNGGETLKPGDKATVVWTAEWKGTSTVKLEYYDGTVWKTLENSVAHSGKYVWTVPSIKSSSVKFKVTSSDGKVWDESNKVFTISSVGVSKDNINTGKAFKAGFDPSVDVVSLYSLSGRLVRKTTDISNNDLRGIPSGTLFVQVQRRGKVISRGMVVVP